MSSTDLLDTITALSKEFGGDAYVRAGGGNTSCKDAATLWVKPSGLALADMTPATFVSLSRARLNELYDQSFPDGDDARESAVKDFIASAITPGCSGRPSVETPLHNAFPQRYVVHTHPAIVNGMTCGNDGAAACARLFPRALWVPFTEPGYLLSVAIRKAMAGYEAKHGKAPELLFLGNHGLFVAHDEADGIRALYNRVVSALEKAVADAGLAGLPERRDPPAAAAASAAKDAAAAIMGPDAAGCAVGGWFKVPAGPLTPDHMVYCRTYMYEGPLTPEGVTAFREKRGYWPRVVATPDMVLGLGNSRKVADTALELAWDAAVVERYAGAFGGVHYLEQRYIDFIENWEVESYRQKLNQ